jgi:hypothetical protein
MATKFLFTELVGDYDSFTARLGAGTGSSNWLSDADVGKFVKFAGDSRYNLCAAGDDIEGHIVAVEVATQDNYTIGTVSRPEGRREVTFDGLQATPGTGTIALGEYVLCGTVVAKGTALSGPPKVVSATTQATPKSGPFACRVVSLGSGGVGTVGGVGIVEFVAS